MAGYIKKYVYVYIYTLIHRRLPLLKICLLLPVYKRCTFVLIKFDSKLPHKKYQEKWEEQVFLLILCNGVVVFVLLTSYACVP